MSQSFFSSSTTHEYRFPFLSQGFQRELPLSFAHLLIKGRHV